MKKNLEPDSLHVIKTFHYKKIFGVTDLFTSVPGLIHMCDNDSFKFVIWLIQICDDRFMCIRCSIQVRKKNHSHVWHDSFTWLPWFIHVCDMNHSRVYHNVLTRVTWLVTRLIHVCTMSHSHVWHDSFIRAIWLIPTCARTRRKCNTLQHIATHCNTLQYAATQHTWSSYRLELI